MLALSSFVLATTLLPCPAARAGHWSLTATGSLTATANGQPVTSPTWSAPSGASTNGLSLSSYEVAAAGYGYPQYHTVGTGAVQISISATVTGTWVPDNGNDPAPPSVTLQETSGAYYKALSGNGTASDGLSNPTDAVVSPYDTNYDASGSSSSTVAHYVKKSGSSWTESFTITASANASNPIGFAKAVAGFSGLTVTIHAQPYGWHDEGHFDANGNQFSGPLIDNTAGTMTFLYTFRSTSGNIADLKGIKVYEYVDYSGNPGSFGTDSTGPYYRPSSPPIGKTANGGIFELDQPHYGYIDPTVPYPRDSTGHTMSYTGDQHSPFPTMKPYSILTITAPQKYEFDDPATNEKGTVLYDPGNIVDAVKLNPNVFYISKSGYSVTSALP